MKVSYSEPSFSVQFWYVKYSILKWLKPILFYGGFLLVVAGCWSMAVDPEIIKDLNKVKEVITQAFLLYGSGIGCVVISSFIHER
ncbi:MAG: hypothetical protein HQL68_08565 [Magnetococcales bacterium]|nr:hypothetical protein [Magnetococcales bacterium]